VLRAGVVLSQRMRRDRRLVGMTDELASVLRSFGRPNRAAYTCELRNEFGVDPRLRLHNRYSFTARTCTHWTEAVEVGRDREIRPWDERSKNDFGSHRSSLAGTEERIGLRQPYTVGRRTFLAGLLF